MPFTTMQRDLVVAGFRSVVMFDGGYAFGYEDGRRMLFGRVPGWQPIGLSDRTIAELRCGRNVALTGLAIKTR